MHPCCNAAELCFTEQHWCSEEQGFVAVHPCCNAAELCEVKKLIGVIALTSKAVSHLASQSSTGAVSEQGLRLCCCASLL